MVITHVAPLSCAKVAGLLYVLMGLIAGALLSVVSLAGGLGANQSVGALGALFGVGAVVLLPICYGALGFVMTLIMTWLFNVAVGMVGGIEIDLK